MFIGDLQLVPADLAPLYLVQPAFPILLVGCTLRSSQTKPLFSYDINWTVCALQLPIPLARHSPHDLHVHVHPRRSTAAHRQEQAGVRESPITLLLSLTFRFLSCRRFLGLFWMSARIGKSSSHRFRGTHSGSPLRRPHAHILRTGERLSPWVSMACIAMAITILIQ